LNDSCPYVVESLLQCIGKEFGCPFMSPKNKNTSLVALSETRDDNFSPFPSRGSCCMTKQLMMASIRLRLCYSFFTVSVTRADATPRPV